MTGLRIAAIALMACVLGACQSDLDRRYLDATLGKRLELPPNLIEPQTEASFELPEVFYRGAADDGKGLPVLINLNSIRLEGSGNLYWLSLTDPVERLYPLAREFWAVEGYTLELDQPSIGVMRTNWSFSEQGENSGNWFQKLLGNSRFASTQDQFITRFERDADGGTRIYIAHRGTMMNYIDPEPGSPQAEYNLKSKVWGFRLSEPELEIEMLSRMMIFFGLEQEQIDRQRARLALFPPRATLVFDQDGDPPVLVLNDPYQLSWNRVYHQLERMGYRISQSSFARDVMGNGSIVVDIDLDEPVAAAETGFFSRIFGKDTRPRVRRFELSISEQDKRSTRVTININDTDAQSLERRDEFARLLFQQVR